MKKLPALLPALLLVLQSHAQDTLFRFALVTDTHIGVQTAQEDLERTVNDINNQPQVEFVVFSGDVTEFGSDEELKLAKSILDKLNKPWHIIPGNHDTKWSESGCNSFRTVFGNETFSFEHKGYRFLGTNCGPNMRMGPGQVPRENIVWLDEQLKKQKDKQQPLIYINHYPQDEGLNNWYDVLDRLRGYNVKVMICGHGHANNKYTWEGIPGVMCRSNLRAKAAIGGYNIVSVTGRSITFNERTPGRETLPAWHTVALNGHAWTQNPPRPSYAVNDSFPSVKVKWSIQETGDMGSAVAVANDMVIYTTTNGDVKAAALHTGKSRWKFTTGGKIYATPLVYGEYVVVPSTDGYVYCLRLKNGKQAWKQQTNKAIVSSAAVYGELAIIAGSDGHCRAWHIPTGKQVWDYAKVKGFVETKPFVYEGKVFFGSWGNEFYALDAATGREAWIWNNGASNRMFSPAAVWPVAYDHKAWIVSPDKYMTVLDTDSGKEIWRYRDSLNSVRESMGISADSQRIYAKTMQGNIIALSTRGGQREIAWKSPVEMGYEICPSPVNERKNILYAAGQSGVVYALSAADGRLVWKHKFSNCLVNTVQPVGDKLVLASSMDGKLVCIEAVQ
ncbi:PQQ-binding-like beta-propeller repeat protein [Chitinophaga barathri]|uniref:Metallophosphoesterase n=1 Tax=Chitinophaga barathri TaxID=1647451 RepID=A0A3N4MQ75_9BACT|nr:PQQ-binding-like beta-propeller repeat protein [Chitinophaga barathri]RPD41819.1 metallophosphoesterase [Chitinophaga barathri]